MENVETGKIANLDVARQQFEASKAILLTPLKEQRATLKKQLVRVEKEMVEIDPKSLEDSQMPTRIDYAARKLLCTSEEGMTLDELKEALKQHKSLSKLEESLKGDSKVEERGDKWFLK